MAAPTIDATVGGSTSNSFATLIEADTYHEERLHNSIWVERDVDDKNRALVWAARLLNQLVYRGNPVSETQAMAWPRRGVRTYDGFEIEEDAIPNEVKWAQSELAYHLIKDHDLTEGRADDVRSVSFGPMMVAMNAGVLRGVSPSVRGGASGIAMMPELVKNYLRGLTTMAHNARVVRG